MDRNVDPDKDSLTDDVSLSARRAWIEITQRRDFKALGLSLSARRAWIEMLICASWTAPSRSLSARRAWIEISMLYNAEKS